jgi:hypothetical protein
MVVSDLQNRYIAFVSFVMAARSQGIRAIPCKIWHDEKGKSILTNMGMNALVKSDMYLEPCKCERKDGKIC